MRTLAILFVAALAASAQPNSFSRLSLYPTGPTPAYLRLFEVRANGNNHVAIQAANSIAADCTFSLSDVLFEPCFHNQVDLGTNAVRFKKAWTQDLETAALTVGGAAGFAGNISFSGTATPLFSGLGSIGTASLPYGTLNAFHVVAQSTLRLGSSATAGHCLIADSSAFGTWQTCPGGISTINGSSVANQTITIGTAGAAPNIASGGGTVTVNIPPANASTEGTVTTTTQDFSGDKNFLAELSAQGPIYADRATSPALIVSSATAYNALDIQNGGGAAITWFASSSLNTTGTVAVGPSIVSLQAVIDSNGNLFPYSHFGSDQGTASKRYNVHYGRFLNLRTNGGSLAGVMARDGSNNLTFSMGDGGGTGGEFMFFSGAGTEYFAAINGQVRYNGSNGLTSSVSCGAGQAVKTINVKQGGIITATCGTP